MTYIPHTESERRQMLERIGVPSIEALFEAVPEAYRFPKVSLPEPVSEIEILAELQALASRNIDLSTRPCFLGAGAARHFVPSVVRHILSRSEFYTAYTPYQPEISQGTLQAIFEYQTMICRLTNMEVSNASHYDGATAMAEAAMMAVAISQHKRRQVLLAPDIHPEYRQVVRTYTQAMGLTIAGDEALETSLADLVQRVDENTACLIVQTPNFYGRIHDLTGLADALHAKGALLIVACDPISLGLLRPPGDFGADIVIGEGQPLGIDLQFGGPYLGFFACRKAHVRRMAGRLVGETVDMEGRRGYVLTLATREQHIRRERATSNICTNQGLNVLAAAVYLSALGKRGLAHVARLCYHRAHYAAQRINALPGYSVDLETPFFKEFVIRCPLPAQEINARLLEAFGIVGGYDLGKIDPSKDHEMLLCVTEMNAAAEIDRLVAALAEVAR